MNPDHFENIPQAFLHQVVSDGSRQIYSQAKLIDSQKVWESVSNAACAKRVAALANHFRKVGVTKGTKVAIISNSRAEWLECDLAILCCGGVVVSVYQSLLASDIAYILFDSESEIVVAENQEQVDKLKEISEQKVAIPATEDRQSQEVNLSIKSILTLEKVDSNLNCDYFAEVVEAAGVDDLPDPAWFEDLKKDDLAALVYTSGTTGPPKGVMQTHGNHLANVRQVVEAGLVDGETSLMLFLPLAHSFAKLIGYIAFLTKANIKFPAVTSVKSSRQDPHSVMTDIRGANSTVIPMVPRILEKMRNGIITSSKSDGLSAKLLRLAIWSAREMSADGRKGILARIAFAGTKAIREKVKRKLFGGNFIFALSGGAKLPVEVAKFFESLEIEVLEGYGLTETCVATNVNRIKAKKIGSVGPVLSDDIELKITDEGEISFKGPNITSGYYKRPTATSDSWDNNGWFHTGDLGEVDKDGFLFITGRKKDLIVTAGGKKVAPQGIEERVVATEYISQVVMLGDAKPYCVALVTIDKEAIGSWAKRENVDLSSGIITNQEVYNLIWGDIDKINDDLASFETIKKIALIEDEFSVENGLLTPSFKIKRKEVQKRYQELLDSLYSKN